MEPKYCFHHHMDSRKEIVSAMHVTHFVRENSVKLSRIQVLQQMRRQDQDRSYDSNDPRFFRARRNKRTYRDREIDRSAGSQRRSDSQPVPASQQQQSQDA